MTGTPDLPTTCCATTTYCGCGRYTRGSLVGDWLLGGLRGAARALRRSLLRRPHRFHYAEDGGLLLPDWVASLWEDGAAR